MTIDERIANMVPEIRELYLTIRSLILAQAGIPLIEKLWSNLPTFTDGEHFIRVIPFKDHLNIEAKAIQNYSDELKDFKMTPKGMLQIGIKQRIPEEILIRIIIETFSS